MPAPLPHPTRKFDARIRKDDLDYLATVLPTRGRSVTEFIRDLVHDAVEQDRTRMQRQIAAAAFTSPQATKQGGG